jgi:Mg/Co/Ni transporter MgtE
MKKQKFILTVILLAIFISSIVSFAGAEGTTRIAMLVKNLKLVEMEV